MIHHHGHPHCYLGPDQKTYHPIGSRNVCTMKAGPLEWLRRTFGKAKEKSPTCWCKPGSDPSKEFCPDHTPVVDLGGEK
jgi:hypothetical protein